MTKSHIRKFCYIFAASVIVAMFMPVLGGCVVDGKTQTISLTVNQSPIELFVGGSMQLTAECSDAAMSVEWLTADEEICSVSNGLITGVSVGVTRVYAVCGDVVASCEVVVKAAENPDEEKDNIIIVSLTPVTIAIGESFEFQAVAPNGGNIIWFSQESSVATVSNGIVTGVSVGETYVTATVGSGKNTATTKCKVVVVEEIIRPAPSALRSAYSLVWSDEFDGTSLDETKWGYQLGTGSSEGLSYWGNNEQQYYTNSSENVGVKDGNLYITAKKQSMGDRSYTSARILTRDKYSFTYGYIEAKMKLPTGTGMWPAFWMLPQNSVYGGWPDSGEIDIMEARGRVTGSIGTALHCSPNVGAHQNSTFADSAVLSSPIDEWHTYGLEWTSDRITWYVDGVSVMTVGKTSWNIDGTSAPFDNAFFVLFNLAVGGNYDSGLTPDEDFVSATMLVDYVRVFKKVYA